MRPDIGSKDMHDDIAEIHEHPLRGGGPFDAKGRGALAGQDAVDGIRNRPDLALRLSGAQYQVVCNRRKPGDIQNEDVCGLFFHGGLRDGDSFRFSSLDDQLSSLYNSWQSI